MGNYFSPPVSLLLAVALLFPLLPFPQLICPSFAHHPLLYFLPHFFPSFVIMPSPTLTSSTLPSLLPFSLLPHLYPHLLYLLHPLLLFLSPLSFSSSMYRVVSGGCGMTLWGNRSPPSSLETSTALPRSTEVTTGYLPFASSSLSPYLLY